MEKKSHGEGKNAYFNMKTARIVKEVGVQAEVDAERDHKGTFEGDEYDASDVTEIDTVHKLSHWFSRNIM
ncbi:unnamed protein product [Anisakis simplex]|uniref:Nucleotide-binding alpha-beta plait domain-containing protein n=1 Tax=Anisakis simplex TaxID=6269 RepID=A0A0M3JGX4_ANISI|nr:unnamed protein product [Anisakis simplex]